MYKAEIKQRKIHQMNFVIRKIVKLNQIKLHNSKISGSLAPLIEIIK